MLLIVNYEVEASTCFIPYEIDNISFRHSLVPDSNGKIEWMKGSTEIDKPIPNYRSSEWRGLNNNKSLEKGKNLSYDSLNILAESDMLMSLRWARPKSSWTFRDTEEEIKWNEINGKQIFVKVNEASFSIATKKSSVGAHMEGQPSDVGRQIKYVDMTIDQ